MADPMVLGSISNLDIYHQDFFNAAKNGNKKILKRLVDAGKISDVDVKNDHGQTPLFFASFAGNEDCIRFLLEKGANPNEESDEGHTPLHAACFDGCIKAVSALVERGGDFRLHDKEHRTAKDWAMLNPNAKKRQLMTEYIVKTRMFAMTHSGRDVLLEPQSSMYMRRNTDNTGSMAMLFRRLSSKGGGGEHIKTSASVMSLGYGKVYGGEKGGTISTIPMVAESMLKHDDFTTTFSNGSFFIMEGMLLGPSRVTVKRLHHDPPKGGVIDHLIRECENIASKRVVKLSVAPLHSALQTIYSEINLLFKMNEGKPHGLKRKIEAILANEKVMERCRKRQDVDPALMMISGCIPLRTTPECEETESDESVASEIDTMVKEATVHWHTATNLQTQHTSQFITNRDCFSELPSSEVDGPTAISAAAQRAPNNQSIQRPTYTAPSMLQALADNYKGERPLSNGLVSDLNTFFNTNQLDANYGCPPLAVPSWPAYDYMPPDPTLYLKEYQLSGTASQPTHQANYMYPPHVLENNLHGLENGHKNHQEPSQQPEAKEHQQSASDCSKCKSKDALLDVQKNLILHLQTQLAAFQLNRPQPLINSQYVRVEPQQGIIPSDLARMHNMYEILLLSRPTGVFITQDFKYELESHIHERGTYMARRMLYGFYSSYDLAYAGSLSASEIAPGLNPLIVTAIQAFVSTRAKTFASSASIRGALLSEIKMAVKNRQELGFTTFLQDKIRANVNNMSSDRDWQRLAKFGCATIVSGGTTCPAQQHAPDSVFL